VRATVSSFGIGVPRDPFLSIVASMVDARQSNHHPQRRQKPAKRVLVSFADVQAKTDKY